MEAMVILTVVSDTESPTADTVAVSDMADTEVVTVTEDMVMEDTKTDTDMAVTVAVMALEGKLHRHKMGIISSIHFSYKF